MVGIAVTVTIITVITTTVIGIAETLFQTCLDAEGHRHYHGGGDKPRGYSPSGDGSGSPGAVCGAVRAADPFPLYHKSDARFQS